MNEPNNEITFQNAQYRELIQLIKYQRDKLNLQQADLTKVLQCGQVMNMFRF